MGYGDLQIQSVLVNLGIKNASQELLTEIKQANPGSDSDVVHFLNENFNFLSGTDLIDRSCEQTVVQAAKQYRFTKPEQDPKMQDGFKPLIPESLTPTKTPQPSIIGKPSESKTFGQKALNVLDFVGDVYTAYKLSSWQCGALADLLGLDKYALSGIDYVLDMGKNYIATLLNAPKQVKELTAKVEEVTTQKEELKSQLDETVGQLQEVKAEKEELKAVVEEVTTQKEDIQIQLAEKAKDMTKCAAEVCKLTKERNVAVSAILLVIVAAIGILVAGGFTKVVYDNARRKL